MNLDKKEWQLHQGTSAKSRTKTCTSFETMAPFIAHRNFRVYLSFLRRRKEISDIILCKTCVQNDKSSDKLSCVCPWFLSINQTRPTHGLSLISSVFKTKRIAAIRRINLRFNERKKKSTTRFYRFRSLSSSYAKNMHGFEWKKSGKLSCARKNVHTKRK